MVASDCPCGCGKKPGKCGGGMQYQLYVKPYSEFDDTGPNRRDGGTTSGPNRYVPPTTDIRKLEQTMYIPVIPTKPGGEREVTFPMTPRTLGQPDVTTSCCVPVLPCQPGFKYLSEHIKPTAAEICKQGNFCGGGNNLSHRTCEYSGGLQCCQGGMTSAPRNVAGDAFVGVPDTFPPVNMRQDLPPSSGYGQPAFQTSGRIPQLYTAGHPAQIYDGQANCANMQQQPNQNQNQGGKQCSSFNQIKNQDTGVKAYKMESPAERHERLTSMFGSHGSCLQIRPMPRRYISAVTMDNVKEQGNGFHWEHPTHSNEHCYMVGQQNNS